MARGAAQGRHAAVPLRRHRLAGGRRGEGRHGTQGVPALPPRRSRLGGRAHEARGASGYLSVCLTVDVQWYGRRERDIVNRYIPREAMSKAPNPRGPDQTYQARLTWDDVEWLRKTVRLPIGVKGIMTPDDARRAVEHGVDIVWVSNHGGRQLDQTQAAPSTRCRPSWTPSAGAATIVVDGGFCRGTDVAKALARGADLVAIGRTALWGLAADGAAGVARVMEILREELSTTLALSGQTTRQGAQARLRLPGGLSGAPRAAPPARYFVALSTSLPPSRRVPCRSPCRCRRPCRSSRRPSEPAPSRRPPVPSAVSQSTTVRSSRARVGVITEARRKPRTKTITTTTPMM